MTVDNIFFPTLLCRHFTTDESLWILHSCLWHQTKNGPFSDGIMDGNPSNFRLDITTEFGPRSIVPERMWWQLLSFYIPQSSLVYLAEITSAKQVASMSDALWTDAWPGQTSWNNPFLAVSEPINRKKFCLRSPFKIYCPQLPGSSITCNFWKGGSGSRTPL